PARSTTSAASIALRRRAASGPAATGRSPSTRARATKTCSLPCKPSARRNDGTLDPGAHGATRGGQHEGTQGEPPRRLQEGESLTKARRGRGQGSAEAQGLRKEAEEAARRAREAPAVGAAQGAQDLHRVRGTRWRRKGRHHQGHHGTGQPARV